MIPRSQHHRSGAALYSLFAGAFRMFAWLNGIAALILMCFGLVTSGGDSSGPDLQWPLIFFLAGLMACGVGLLFAYLAQLSVLRQVLAGYLGRRHWLALVLSVLCYLVGIAAFCVGCWLATGATVPDLLPLRSTVFAAR